MNKRRLGCALMILSVPFLWIYVLMALDALYGLVFALTVSDDEPATYVLKQSPLIDISSGISSGEELIGSSKQPQWQLVGITGSDGGKAVFFMSTLVPGIVLFCGGAYLVRTRA